MAGERRPSLILEKFISNQALSNLARTAGECLFKRGETGSAWRLLSGLVRLDQVDADGQRVFASLAVAGDILGCETQLFGEYTFTATALTQCELSPWPGEFSLDTHNFLNSLAQAQRRAVDLLALRGGLAARRVIQLVRLLADEQGRVVLPTRGDIAEITDLRLETVSRIIHDLIRDQAITPLKIEGVHATRSFVMSPSLT